MDHNGYTPLYTIFESLVFGLGMCYADEMGNCIPEDYFDTYIKMAVCLVQAGADITLLYNHDGDHAILPVKMVANLSDIIQKYIDYCTLEDKNRSQRE